MQTRKKFVQPKPIKVVNRKALEKIADNIYNPKTGLFLNLCEGTLQNGPDPACSVERPMHCGLGELYYTVTGRQPEQDHVTDTAVINEVTKRSTIMLLPVATEKRIKKLGLSKELTKSICEKASEELGNVGAFCNLLDSIPSYNDSAGGFKSRAKRVASILRKAAALLPR
jgi:hypothetical protein